MLARIRKAQEEEGFTLIELLVVILIIGVLAAIAIPVFLNQRQGAWEAQVESDIANGSIAAETYSVGNNGSYADLDITELGIAGYNATDHVLLTIGVADATHFTFIVTHTDLPGNTWTYDSATGKVEKS